MTDTLYAQVQDPIEVRKEILQSTKVVLDELKGVEDFKGILIERHKLMDEFRVRSADLNRLLGRLRARLPKTAVKTHAVSKVEPRPPQRQEVKVKPQVPHKSKLQRLEEELAKIEAKLQTLE